MATATVRKLSPQFETPLETPALTLDALHEMSFAELDALYRRSPAPAAVAALDGKPEGRMLALHKTENGPLARFARAFAKSRYFIWFGKNFSSQGETGEGINRINLLRRYQPLWFRFETDLAPSLLDGKPCLRLNYGLPENPPGIRHIIDEVREVGPGLYLGPANLVFGQRKPFTALYFALSFGG